ncbi:MAG: ATP-binding protein [Xanthomonadales bacterium]|nr:ATP-binding protein [Xanthomonadales bacterium]
MLWAMRMLTRVKGGSEFLSRSGFSDDALAEKLGLGPWVESDCDKARLQAMRERLQVLEHWASRTEAGVPVALAAHVSRLGELVGLTARERRLMEFVAMLHLDPILENAALYSGNGSRDTLHATLAHVLRLDITDVRQALAPTGPLLKSGLVTVSPRASQTLDDRIALLSPRFADALLQPSEDVVDLLAHAVSRCAVPTLVRHDYVHVEDLLTILVPHLAESLASGRIGVNLLVYGRPGTGKSELARVLAAEVGAAAFEIASESEDGELLRGEMRLQAHRLAQSLLNARNALLVFDESEDVFRESVIGLRGSAAQSHKAWMNRMLEDNRVPTVWISNSIDDLDPAFVRRFDGIIELGVPPRLQRKQLVQRYAGAMVNTADAGRIAESANVTPALLSRACAVVASAQRRADSIGASGAVVRLIDSTLRAQGEPALLSRADALPPYYDPRYLTTDADLVSIAEGIRREGAARICLYGPPGTGKSALGAWLARHLERPLLQRKASELLGMYVGQTEKGIATAFREAHRDGAILMLDEVDTFLRDRRNGQRNWELSMVNELLVQMEQFNGVFIASTNLMDVLDQAALRRFDLKLKLGYLKPDQASDLLQVVCADLGLDATESGMVGLLRGLDVLTPGDFAAMARLHRFEPFRSAEALAVALRSECALKEDGRRHRMGFTWSQ